MHRRTTILLLAVALLPLLGACRGRGGGGATAAGATTPVSRLSELLRRGAQPGELTLAERAEVERLVTGLLPKLAGPLAGYEWRVAYDDLPVGDFVSVDLLQGSGEAAPRAIWFHLVWRGALTAAEREAWGAQLGRFPARGVPGHHLFVRAGGVELRAVAEAPAFRDDSRLRDLVGRFDLDALARL